MSTIRVRGERVKCKFFFVELLRIDKLSYQVHGRATTIGDIVRLVLQSVPSYALQSTRA